jgi:hypothetical protein
MEILKDIKKGDIIKTTSGFFIALKDIPNEQYVMTFGLLDTLLIKRIEFKMVVNIDEASSIFKKQNPIVSTWSEGEQMNEQRKNNGYSFSNFMKEKYGIRDMCDITPFC